MKKVKWRVIFCCTQRLIFKIYFIILFIHFFLCNVFIFSPMQPLTKIYSENIMKVHSNPPSSSSVFGPVSLLYRVSPGEGPGNVVYMHVPQLGCSQESLKKESLSDRETCLPQKSYYWSPGIYSVTWQGDNKPRQSWGEAFVAIFVLWTPLADWSSLWTFLSMSEGNANLQSLMKIKMLLSPPLCSWTS